ncbi:MAG TPA: hypothetical protein VND89_09355 [Acidimicrobiales bacterium]|nr:hypothetical protein [Acidimicrobiales bacterium]
MLLIILALFWVALLAPIVVRRLRDSGTEKSIQSFHAEHEVLSRQDYTVTPAHRLDQPDWAAPPAPVSERKPRLAVVHADDTFGSLESRATWDEWSEDYEYDGAARRNAAPSNRYAQAYSSRQSEPVVTSSYDPPIRRRTMKSQRCMVFTRLVLAAVVTSLIAFVSGYSLLVDIAALTWLGVVGFVALAFYAVSQGYLNDSSLPLRLPKRRDLATIEPLYAERYDRYAPHYEDEFTSEFYEPDAEEQWRRESQRRQALG